MTATSTTPVSDAADWELARRVAARVAGHDPLERSYLADGLTSDFDAATTRAEELVAEDTGLVSSAGPAVCRVIDRSGWVDANLEGFQRILAPISERLAQAAPSVVKKGGRAVVGAELGVLLGFLSRRVLGQYDLFLPEDQGGMVFYVGPNILGLEKRFAFPPDSFRLWVALHEVTHRAQFTGVPWMKGYFLSMVDETVSGLDPDPKRLLDAIMRAVDMLRKGEDPLAEGGIVGLLVSPEQRQILNRVQALMSLLEGHGNVVMDRLGEKHVAEQSRMSQALRARRQQGGFQQLFYKLTGFEMKVQQYEMGEKFIRAVEERAGAGILDTAWQSPEALPTLDEIRHPDAWLERVR